MDDIVIQQYKEFCQINEKQIPIFFQPYWLDIVCYKGQWNVILHFDDKGTINGILAYYLTKKYGQIIITNPPLTPHSGILVIETDVKSDSIKIIETLISKLPATTYYTQSYEPDFTNWLPMYWKGYTQTTRITYVIDNVRDWNMKMCTDQTYRKIKKGATKFTIQYSENFKDVFEFAEKLWLSKKLGIPIGENQFLILDKELALKNKRKILVAKDKNNQIQAAVYLVFDLNSVYALLIGSDPYYRDNNGAVHYLLSQAIEISSKYADTFNFEGSMIKGLASLYSSFGAKQLPYYRIYKAKNIFWDIAYRIKSYYDKNNR